ncbi:MAG: hypothetical protein JNK25_03915 [Phycisphaerae bacterium]|nr:hypothetical protein [Phycisphaerae bacterium]
MNGLVLASVAAFRVCAAGGPTTGAESLRAFWEAASTRRVDVVMIGDSTQLFQGHGWDEGWARAMHARSGLFATGLHASGENAGNGAGVGWESITQANASQGQFRYTGAPPHLHSTCGDGLPPLGYLFLPSGESAASLSNAGLTLRVGSPLGVNGPLRFHFVYGQFADGGAGTFRPVVRIDASPFTTLSPLTDISTAGANQVAAGIINIPAAERNSPVAFRWTQAGGPAIRGPFFGSWMRAERPDRISGASVSTIYAAGGHSARDAAADLIAAPDDTLVSFFSLIRSMQQEPSLVLIRVSFGVNDRSETLPSAGPMGILPGNSAAAFEDNIGAIITRLSSIWESQGWGSESLYFVIAVSPPVSDTKDNFLPAYSTAADRIAAQRQRTASVRFDRLTSEAELVERGWYVTPTDRTHLSAEGYIALSDREVGALIAAAMESGGECAADYNRDGGVDGADLEAFFTDWPLGLPRADVNRDGGVDGSDVETFFRAWTAGGC